ncbi:MAG: tagaturonate reductase [Chitinophagaceae bacterium]|nr:tagaturonate reductase [Chitinophagaceae bacterium]
MILCKNSLPDISPAHVSKPSERIFTLPEKVLQFGTGVLLRGLIDYFIDKANNQGIFNGRIVVVKSTDKGDTGAFEQQDGLYTICVQGIEAGQRVNERMINASVSRVLSAKEQWNEILQCASNPALQIIVSNTTEVGISLNPADQIHNGPPVSFPGKLLAFLLARYNAFGGSKESGMVIIPTELIPGNGDALRNICIELARLNKLDQDFIQWLSKENDFCNSLVDRIVPGKLSEKEKLLVERETGYQDELMIMAEPYRLWAIETSDQRTKDILSFSPADEGIVIAPGINKFRELKLRLLNGSHTFTCGLAVLSGFTTVKEAMANKSFNDFISELLYNEIVPAIVEKDLTLNEARQFAQKVLDRYRNPFIDHHWLSITLQYTSKMRMRNVPVLLKYFEKNDLPPVFMSLGFAAYLLFMKGDINYVKVGNGNYITDDKTVIIQQKWKEGDVGKVVSSVLGDIDLWGADLSVLPGLKEAVAVDLEKIMDKGMLKMTATIVKGNH